MTPADAIAAAEALAAEHPWYVYDEASLRRAIRGLLDIDLPDEPCCPDHCSPFDFVYALVFKRNRRTGRKETNILGVGPRGGYKTLGAAIAQVLKAAKGNRLAHIGAIEAQSRRCYGYAQTFFRRPLLRSVVDGVPTMKETKTRTGGGLEILWATRNQLNSPHVPDVTFDEIELAPPEVAAEALGILSDEPGVTPSIAEISSLKYTHGVVQQKIDSAGETGRAVYVWCYKDVTEPCPDWRSGTEPATAYIDREELDALSEDDWKRLTPAERDAYEPVRVFAGCLACPLLPSCRGDLKRAKGLQSIDRLITQYRDASRAFWIMQMESRQATVEGAVFSSFRATGTVRTHVRAREDVGSLDPACGPVWVGLDPGRHHPAAGLWQHVTRPNASLGRFVRRGAVVCFDEVHSYRQDMDLKLPSLVHLITDMLGRNGLDCGPEQWCERCAERHLYRRPPEGVRLACDPAGNQEDDLGESTVQWLEAHGWRVETPQAFIAERIDFIDARLKFVNGLTGMLFMRDRTAAHVQSFRNYRWKDDPKTGLRFDVPLKDNVNDHCIDETGYLVSAIDMPRYGGRVS